MRLTAQYDEAGVNMDYFDLHCDTISACHSKRQALNSNTLHLSLDKAKGFTKWAQVFALWIPDKFHGASAQTHCELLLHRFQRELAQNENRVEHWKNGTPSPQEGRCTAVLSLENASALNGDIEYLYRLHGAGVKLITLTWNGVNQVGCGALSGKKKGLSDFGFALLDEMARLGIAADVSHLNEAGFDEVAQRENVPMLASHSNAAAVWPHGRSLTDAQIRVLIARRGLMGLCFCRDFLGGADCAGRVEIHRQVEYVLSLGGEDILALGSDFDGAEIPPELNSIGSVPALYVDLAARGISQGILQKIFYDNAMRFFTRNRLQQTKSTV